MPSNTLQALVVRVYIGGSLQMRTLSCSMMDLVFSQWRMLVQHKCISNFYHLNGCYKLLIMAAPALACFSIVAPKVIWNMSGAGSGDNLVRRSISLQKYVSAGGLQIKANTNEAPKLNRMNVSCLSLEAESLAETVDARALNDPSCLGKMLPDGFVFQQGFPIRSYEIGGNGTTSIEWFINHLQETALNHAKIVGLSGIGYGSTEAMSKVNLIWVMTKLQVAVNRYPSWCDVVQFDTWMYANGKNGMSRDWRVVNRITGETLAEASGSWVMMDTSTRRLARIPDDIQQNLALSFMDPCVPIMNDNRKLQKLDESTVDNVKNGLIPQWTDMDLNQHVSNTKYIGWILESCISMLESHELVGLTLEYRKECRKGNMIESLTALGKDSTDKGWFERLHLLRLDNGTELVRGRTTWRPKHVNKCGSVNVV